MATPAAKVQGGDICPCWNGIRGHDEQITHYGVASSELPNAPIADQIGGSRVPAVIGTDYGVWRYLLG